MGHITPTLRISRAEATSGAQQLQLSILRSLNVKTIAIAYLQFSDGESAPRNGIQSPIFGSELMWLAKARHSCRSIQEMTMNCTRVLANTEL